MFRNEIRIMRIYDVSSAYCPSTGWQVIRVTDNLWNGRELKVTARRYLGSLGGFWRKIKVVVKLQ